MLILTRSKRSISFTIQLSTTIVGLTYSLDGFTHIETALNISKNFQHKDVNKASSCIDAVQFPDHLKSFSVLLLVWFQTKQLDWAVMGSKPMQTDKTAHHPFQIHQSLPLSSMSRINSSADKNYDMHPAKCHNIKNGRKERVETAFQCLSPERGCPALTEWGQNKDLTTYTFLSTSTVQNSWYCKVYITQTAKGNGTSETLMHV